MNDAYYTERIAVLLKKLEGRAVKRTVRDRFDIEIAPCEKFYCDTALSGAKWEKFSGTWAGEKRGAYYAFRFFADVPEGGTFRLRFVTQHNRWQWDDCDNPQMLVFIDGVPVQALDFSHRGVGIGGGRHEVVLHACAGMWINEVADEGPRAFVLDVFLEEIDKAVESLCYDLKVPFETMLLYGEEDPVRIRTRVALNAALNEIDFREGGEFFERSVIAAKETFKREYYDKVPAAEASAVCVGHSHIDVGWLWTAQKAREKAVRTFTTAAALMKKYPEYTFFASQPVLYKYVRETAPALFAEIAARIREGRWEAEGAMWLEADVNIPSGESLIRQILFGKRFLKETFGKDSRILWLPDDFGFPASLPQIMKLCGVDTLCTQKLTLNDTNKMPHDLFFWKGIDSSSVFCYFLTAQDVPLADGGGGRRAYTTYSSTVTPRQILGAWKGFADKEISSEVLIAYGFGDGGGGPNEEQLLTLRRTEKGVYGLPRTACGSVEKFLQERREEAECSDRAAVWSGEMYFEFHRGVYTSVARNKQGNFAAETALHDAEWLATMAWAIADFCYPQKELNDCWEKVLEYQFHDVLPGTAIKEVYEETDKGYALVMSALRKIKENAAKAVVKKAGVKTLTFNPAPFAAENGKIPPYGYVAGAAKPVCEKTVCGDDFMENDRLRVSFDGNGEIVSIIDKRARRDLVIAGGRANRLALYEDIPNVFDAWEIRAYYREKRYGIGRAERFTPVEVAGRKGFEVVRRYRNSVIRQKITLADGSARIDFDTEIDWHEKHTLLKAEFDVAVNAQRSAAEIQFGFVERQIDRNTSWESAKFEVCAHKYFDLSEGDYGAALLCGAKYGYGAEENKMTISLLRGPQHPYKDADEGLHRFTYCFYPHEGDSIRSDVVRQAYLLADPPFVYGGAAEKSGESYCFLRCDEEKIVIETVKRSEDEKGVIIRAYESGNGRKRAVFSLGFAFSRAALCDALENEIETLESKGGAFVYTFRPFEIATFKICVDKGER